MRVLVADDDAFVIESYKAVFAAAVPGRAASDLIAMAASLFEAPGEKTETDDGSVGLSELGVTYVSQGLDAVEAVRKGRDQGEPFQIIFLDMRMPPGIGGKETARLIREIDSQIHIVMVTGYSDSSPLAVAQVAGPLSRLFYVVKPFEPDEILQMTRALVDKWQLEHELAEAHARLEDQVRQLEDANVQIAAGEARVRHAAYHDALTGLPNRAAFLRELNTRISGNDLDFAVAMIDLDRFKAVNDIFGHGGGDELIRLLGKALNGAVPDDCLVARLGGDEFGVILPSPQAPDFKSLLGSLLEVCSEERQIFGHSVHGSASIGFAACKAEGERDPIDIMRRADLALYAAKQAGRGMIKPFDQSLDDSSRFRLSIEQGLRKAIAEDGLSLVYQPIVQLDTLEVVGFEALVRWESAEHGSVSPSLFVPIAEEGALIHELSNWVVPRALAAAAQWHGLFISINFSPRQFQRPKLLQMLIDSCDAAGIARDLVQVEITETALFDNVDMAMEIVNDLQKAGFRIALDDFGTGYSSLFNLKNFNIDCIKIDRSFVDALGKESNSTAIVASISHLAKTMGLSVVAEGVENEFQHHALQLSGCSHMQGFHFGKPVGQAEATASVNAGLPSAAVRKAAA